MKTQASGDGNIFCLDMANHLQNPMVLRRVFATQLLVTRQRGCNALGLALLSKNHFFFFSLFLTNKSDPGPA